MKIVVDRGCDFLYTVLQAGWSSAECEAMITGETISNGGDATCPDCNITPKLDVYRSAAGYYIGTYCDCGPYSRESDYFRTWDDAMEQLNAILYNGED